MFVLTNDKGRVQVCYDRCAPTEAVEVAEPNGWDSSRIFDWVLRNGALAYDPLPIEPELVPEPEPDYDTAFVELANLLDEALTKIEHLESIIAAQ